MSTIGCDNVAPYPYLAFAKQAGAVPVDGTKQSHPDERKLFKACALAVQYGMGAESLGYRISDLRSPVEGWDVFIRTIEIQYKYFKRSLKE